MKKNVQKISHVFLGLLFTLIGKFSFAQLQFSIGSVPSATTATVTIPITTNNFTNIAGFQGSINWDNTKLTFNSTANLNTTITGFGGLNFSNSVSGGTGRLGYIWNDNNATGRSLTNGSKLFDLVLNLVPTAVGTVSLSFSNTPTNLDVIDGNLVAVTGVVYNPGTVTIPWALPANIEAFSAIRTNNTIGVNWTVLSETNVAYYEVEKSKNGVSFESIGKVNAVGIVNTTKKYAFTDVSINTSTVFYRVKIVDNDATVKYTKMVAVKSDDKLLDMLIYPNPVKENLALQIKYNKTENAFLQVTDMLGKLLLQQSVQLVNGSSSFSINVTSLVKGNYVVAVKAEERVYTQQFTKD